MISNKNGGILISACYGALTTAILAIIIASSVLVTLQGIKQSQIILEGIFLGNNVIEHIKLKDLDNYSQNDLKEEIEKEGIPMNNGEKFNISVFVSKIEDFYSIEVILQYNWGQQIKNLKVEGFKYGG